MIDPAGRGLGGPASHAYMAIVAIAVLQGLLAVAGLSSAALAGPDVPGLLREGDGLSVPDGSPYRERIVVRPVERKIFGATMALPAQVEADPARVHTILPPLGGRVENLRVDLGSRVQKGDPLVVIDSGDLAQAVADVSKAASQVALTHRALDRARGLIKAGGGAVKDLESAVNDAAQADAEAGRTRSRLDTISGSAAASGQRTFTVVSPADGVVTALSVSDGAYINDTTQSMMTITNLDEAWVTANVPESDMSFISKNQPVDVRLVAYPDQTFHGRVLFIGDILETDTRRTKVRIALSGDDGRLKPNMFATATFHAPARPTLLVPNGALLMNNDSTTVFVETSPWRFVRREVSTGSEVDGSTVVTSGLSAGDHIVVRGGVLLND